MNGELLNVKFDDVKGCKESLKDLEEIVLYLKDPARFQRLGGKLPKGVLLTGPPGTGKTLLAKAIAGESGAPFFYASGSEFEEVYVGVGARRVRDLFARAKKAAKENEKKAAIIFIDEIDAIGGNRRLKDQSAMKMTLNQMLVEMDGFEGNTGVIVIGATNFSESLDKALTRPGRLDKSIEVPLPDVAGRLELLEHYGKKTKLAKDVDLEELARGVPGMSGAEIENLINQAAVKASFDDLPAVNNATLQYAKDKILMGAEKVSAVIQPETAKCTAYHEAGHALVNILTDGSNQIHKATIMPRGNSLGMVMQLPEGDQKSQSYKQMMAFIDVCYGGRVAEELTFGPENITSGASSDIYQASKTARALVTKYGFSEKVGYVFHDGNSGQAESSGKTRQLIDDEVKQLCDESYARVKKLLTENKAAHERLAKALMQYETLTGQECIDIVKKSKMPSRPIVNSKGGARGNIDMLKPKKDRSELGGGLFGLGKITRKFTDAVRGGSSEEEEKDKGK